MRNLDPVLQQINMVSICFLFLFFLFVCLFVCLFVFSVFGSYCTLLLYSLNYLALGLETLFPNIGA